MTNNSRSVTYFSERTTQRLQKIPVNAGFTCPNRDGTLSHDGCFFCSNESFSPFYCSAEKTITAQLKEGITFFSRKYKCDGYLAYFQTHSCTHASVSNLASLYHEALSVEGIDGLVIATRPDCLNSEVFNLLKSLNGQNNIRLEIGIESLNNQVLSSINRCHNPTQSLKAIEDAKKAGIEICGHIILGLPGESTESQIHGAKIISATGLTSLKIHHLQIVKGSKFAEQFEVHPESFSLLTLNQYVEILAQFISHLSPKIAIERLSNRVPLTYLLGPIWNGVTETQLRAHLARAMIEKDLFQGCKL